MKNLILSILAAFRAASYDPSAYCGGLEKYLY